MNTAAGSLASNESKDIKHSSKHAIEAIHKGYYQ